MILITGGCGFIGSNTVDYLINKGENVIVVDKKIRNENPRAIYKRININNIKKLESIFKEYEITHILHLAAYISLPKSIVEPVTCLRTNIMGTANVFEMGRKYDVNKIVFASSSSTYNIKSPYALSKQVDEGLGKMYSQVYGLHIAGLRYFNVYGPRQMLGPVIPNFIVNMLNNKKIIIYGKGRQTRDFIFVKDVARVNYMFLKNKKDGIFEVGSGVETQIIDLFNMLAKMISYNKKPLFKQERIGDVKTSVAKEKIIKTTSLKKGLEETIRYYDEHRII